MSKDDVQVVRGLYEHMGRGEYSFPGLLDDDMVYARHGRALGMLEGEWRGLDDVWDAVLEYLRSWEGLRNELEDVTDLDDGRVFVLERQTGRGRASGVAMEREMASLFTLRNGKVSRWDSYWDRDDARRDAGLAG
jgi:ketosteroid isomerase-like protein